MIPAVDIQIGDVQEQAAVRPVTDFVQEIRLTQFSRQAQLGSHVLQQQRFAATFADFPRMVGNDGHSPPQKLAIPVTGTGTTLVSGIRVPSPGGGWTVLWAAARPGADPSTERRAH